MRYGGAPREVGEVGSRRDTKDRKKKKKGKSRRENEVFPFHKGSFEGVR